jgi:hypothetical protein
MTPARRLVTRGTVADGAVVEAIVATDLTEPEAQAVVLESTELALG